MTREVPEVATFAPGGDGTRMSAFESDGLRVTVVALDAELNERAFERACAYARHGCVIADLQDRNAALRAELESARAKIPPARPARLLGEGCVRTDRGAIWLLGNREKGWSSFGVRFDSWDQLFREYDVEIGEFATDEHGGYWTARNRGAV